MSKIIMDECTAPHTAAMDTWIRSAEVRVGAGTLL